MRHLATCTVSATGRLLSLLPYIGTVGLIFWGLVTAARAAGLETL